MLIIVNLMMLIFKHLLCKLQEFNYLNYKLIKFKILILIEILDLLMLMLKETLIIILILPMNKDKPMLKILIQELLQVKEVILMLLMLLVLM